MGSEIVQIRKCTEELELYCRYDRQIDPQNVYMYLDLESGELQCRYNPEIGCSVPSSVLNGTVRRWIMAGIPTGEEANDLMQTVEPYAQRILDGSTVTHSGSNWIGILNDDAKNAEYWITSFLSDQDCDSGYVDEWSPADWIGEGNRDVHDYMTEEAIQTVMNTYFRNQHSDIGPVVFSSDPEKWIRQRMEEDRQSS